MYEIVIVDDESIVSRGLSEKVKWQDLNCRIVAIGSNGFEGRKLVDRLQPDIVITDIKMPGMNGLELAEYIKKHHPNTIVILLSGYSEFAYARDAVRHQVFDYLLKPIEIIDLETCIKKAIAHIRKVRSTKLIFDKNREDLEQKHTLAESGILMNLIINGNKDIGTWKKKMKDLDITLPRGQIVVFELYESVEPAFEKISSNYQFAINNILKETYQDHTIHTTIINIKNKSVAIINLDTEMPSKTFQKKLIEVSNTCGENIKSYIKKKVNTGIGKTFRGIDDFYASYQSAVIDLETNLFWGTNEITINRHPEEGKSRGTIQVNPHFFESLYIGDYDKSEKHIENFLGKIKQTEDKNFALNSLLDLLVEILKHVSNGEVKNHITQVITNIYTLRTFDKYGSIVYEIVRMICDEVQSKRRDSKTSLFDQIKSYVNIHYDESYMTLQYTADLFHVSSSHLSRLFKSEAGINFSDYLSIKRLKKAKELLENDTNLSVFEIANRVGFIDGKYFGQVFKKYYGVTPSYFKDMVKSQRHKEIKMKLKASS